MASLQTLANTPSGFSPICCAVQIINEKVRTKKPRPIFAASSSSVIFSMCSMYSFSSSGNSLKISDGSLIFVGDGDDGDLVGDAVALSTFPSSSLLLP